MLGLVHGPRALMALPALTVRYAPWGLSLLWRAFVGAGQRVFVVFGAILSPVGALFRAAGRILEPYYLGLLMVAQPLLAPLAPAFSPVISAARVITGRLCWCWQCVARLLRGCAASAA